MQLIMVIQYFSIYPVGSRSVRVLELVRNKLTIWLLLLVSSLRFTVFRTLHLDMHFCIYEYVRVISVLYNVQ